MIRFKKIIRKSDIFDYMNNPDVVSVVMPTILNKNLKDDLSCKVHIFVGYNGDFKTSILTVLGSMRKSIDVIPIGKDRDYLKALEYNQRRLQWLSFGHIKKLVDLEEKYNLNLSIPTWIFETNDKLCKHTYNLK